MTNKIKKPQQKLNSLVIEIFGEYQKSPTFQASIYSLNQRYFFRQLHADGINIQRACEETNIDCINFYPKKEEAFDVYPSQYISHKIKENQLELTLKNKAITFDLK
jgi:hypothetical protein